MAVDEAGRHRLHTKLEEVIGPEEAAILMEHLPPVGWADVATKRDLDHHDLANRHEFDAVRIEIAAAADRIRAEMELGFRRIIMWTSGTVLVGMSAAFAAGRFF
jgi:hypothetical protein